MKWFEQYLDSVLVDDRLSRQESRTLSGLFDTHRPDRQAMALLRSKLFDRLGAKTNVDAEARLDVAESVVRTIASWEAENASGDASFETLFFPGRKPHDRLVDLVKGIKKSADICVFTITDNRVTDHLIELCRRGVRIRVISDNDKSLDRGSDIEKMQGAGIECVLDQSEHHMHHKFALLDDKWALTGSYNWTRSAADKNRENILITDERQVVGAFQNEFRRLWKEFS